MLWYLLSRIFLADFRDFCFFGAGWQCTGGGRGCHQTASKALFFPFFWSSQCQAHVLFISLCILTFEIFLFTWQALVHYRAQNCREISCPVAPSSRCRASVSKVLTSNCTEKFRGKKKVHSKVLYTVNLSSRRRASVFESCLYRYKQLYRELSYILLLYCKYNRALTCQNLGHPLNFWLTGSSP